MFFRYCHFFTVIPGKDSITIYLKDSSAEILFDLYNFNFFIFKAKILNNNKYHVGNLV